MVLFRTTATTAVLAALMGSGGAAWAEAKTTTLDHTSSLRHRSNKETDTLAASPATASNGETNKNMGDGIVVLESFDNPVHTWEEQNDPVMGGRSTGTFTIADGLGKFEGEVVDVPFLQAPGFLQARTTAGRGDTTFPDISHCTSIQIIARSNTPYKGYRVSFGNAHPPGGKFFAYGYKSSFTLLDSTSDDVDNAEDKEVLKKDDENNLVVTATKDHFGTVTIPFENFTDYWDDATGDPIKTCQDDPLYCPDEKTLKDIKRLTLWAEGVAGTVSLDVKVIQAVGCSSSTSTITSNNTNNNEEDENEDNQNKKKEQEEDIMTTDMMMA